MPLLPAETQGIAIAGLSGCFAGAGTPRAVWKALLRKQCFLAPPAEAEANRQIDPLLEGCALPAVGAALGENFACRADSIPLPADLGMGDNQDCWFLAQLIHDALADAGLPPTAEGRTDRLALYVGYDPGFNPASVNWLWHANVIRQVLETLQRFFPGATHAQVEALRDELTGTLPPIKRRQLELARGSGVARHLAQLFGACDMTCLCSAGEATVFAGFEAASNALRLNQCDVAVVVAAQPPIAPAQLAGEAALTPFSDKLGLEPFVPGSTGTLPGEGGAAFVLRRLGDLSREGARAYARLHGCAVVSGLAPGEDGAGLHESLRRALHRALRRLPNAFRDIDYWEMNASGIPEEDAAEYALLADATRNRGAHIPLLALGGAKTTFGNTFLAAGALGALKGTLALSHRILPPSVTPVDEGFLLRKSQGDYYWVQEARPWIAARTRPRRLAVSTLSRWGRAGAATLEEIGD